MGSGEKHNERVMVRLDAEMRERVDACQKRLAEHGPESTTAETLRYLVRRGLEAVEGEIKHGRRVVR